MLEDIAEQVTAEQVFAMEFEDDGVYRFIYLRFWKNNKLCRVLICRSGLSSPTLIGEFGSLSRLLSAISTKADIVASSGCHSDIIRTICHSPYFTRGVQSCFRFEKITLSKLMHKTSYSVFGRIDFFSVLKGLLVSLGGSLTEEWVIQSPELTRAISSCTLEMLTLPTLCRELLGQWKNVQQFLTNHAPRQEMQGVRNQVISFTY